MFISYLARGASAEILKTRRSVALAVALTIPLFPAFANVASTLRWGLGRLPEDAATIGPSVRYLRYAIELWVIFAMPFVAAILSALLANIDHKAKGWKMLFALPFPRAAVFAGKALALAGITLLSMLAFALANLAGGLLIELTRPEIGLDVSSAVVEAFARPLLAWLLSAFMLSIHLWISLRWSSFLVSLTVGAAAAISNLFLLGSYLASKAAFFPWAMPARVYEDWRTGVLVSLVGAAVVYALASREFVRRDVY